MSAVNCPSWCQHHWTSDDAIDPTDIVEGHGLAIDEDVTIERYVRHNGRHHDEIVIGGDVHLQPADVPSLIDALQRAVDKHAELIEGAP